MSSNGHYFREAMLDFTTIIARPTIIIDGERYEFRHPHEFTRLELWDLKEEWDAVHATYVSEDILTRELLERRGEAAWRAVHRIIPDLPEEIFARLSDEHILAIAEGFMELASHPRPGLASVHRDGTSTPDSSASMGAIPSSGSDFPTPS